MGRWISDKEYWDNPMGETLDKWLDKQIEYAENECGMYRSYKQPNDRAEGYRDGLKDVRAKMAELWNEKP